MLNTRWFRSSAGLIQLCPENGRHSLLPEYDGRRRCVECRVEYTVSPEPKGSCECGYPISHTGPCGQTF